MVKIFNCVTQFDIQYNLSSAAVCTVCTDQWYEYIPMPCDSTSNSSHHQLQYALINAVSNAYVNRLDFSYKSSSAVLHTFQW